MLPLETAASFFAASFMLAIAPGPDILLVLTLSTLYGAKKGLCLMAGLMTGVFWHLTIISLGIAALIAASPKAFMALKIVGCLYLLYLAWKTITSGALRADIKGKEEAPGGWTLYRRGIIMNMTNPKVTLFMLAFLPQFCSPEYGPMTVQIFSLGFLFQLSSMIVFTAVAFLGGRLAVWLNSNEKGQKIINTCAACVLAGMGILLLFA